MLLKRNAAHESFLHERLAQYYQYKTRTPYEMETLSDQAQSHEQSLKNNILQRALKPIEALTHSKLVDMSTNFHIKSDRRFVRNKNKCK